jgi:subtilase family serine protease
LNGNVHPLARPQYDQGRVGSSMPMRVTLVFKMSAEQQADLDALLARQQDRGSPDYQRWLTPEQYGSRFGLSQADINKVTGWLESEGLQVESIAASQNAIVARGSAQQVEAALRTEIHRYVINGKQQFANSMSPSVPGALGDGDSGAE